MDLVVQYPMCSEDNDGITAVAAPTDWHRPWECLVFTNALEAVFVALKQLGDACRSSLGRGKFDL